MPRKPPPPKVRPVAADNANTAATVIRVPPTLLESLDAWVEALNERATGPKWNRSELIRVALTHAVEMHADKGEAP